MQYLAFIATDPEAEPYLTDEDTIGDWIAEADRRGVRRLGERLRPPEDAITVKVRGGELLVTDGPFTEGREWVAGFDLIECDDLDQAIEVMSTHPMARFGQIEIRPFWPLELE